MAQRTGYQGFGSFHTENVEDLITRDASTYVAPSLPFHTDDCKVSPDLELGKACRNLFLIDFDPWTFINHGAFGGVSVPAHREASKWREYCERQPLKFLDRELFPQLVRVMRHVAAFVNARPQDLVLLPNATTGLNIVIKSCALQPGDVLYMLDIGYGSVKKMLKAVSHQAEVVFGKVDFPISGPQDILDLVAQTMPANTKLAVFDTITSNTALVLPVPELVQMCRERGIPVLVDAAHSLGQQPVDLEGLGADFYVTNCHKWLAGPRGSAFMWVRQDHQAMIKPLVVSHGSGSGFVSDFIWDGCRDYAPFLGLSSALNMWQALGPERCRTYMHNLLSQAVSLLTQQWGTSTLAPLSMCCAMALVGLPPCLAAQEPATSTDAKYVQDMLHTVYKVECPVKCIQGSLYARISAQIYNVLEDYEKLGDAIQDMVQQQQQQQVEE